MNKTTSFITLLAACLFFLPLSGVSQVLTADPVFPTADGPVTLTFDATQGEQGLMGYTGDIYAHTGITADGTQWSHVIAGWDENTDKARLTRVDDNTYTFTIEPSIRDFYGAGANEAITELCIVFRSEDQEQQTADLFYEVYPGGLNISISEPAGSRTVVALDETLHLEATASEGDSIQLWVGQELRETVNNTSLTTDLSFSETGRGTVYVKAFSGEEIAMDSVSVFVRGEVPVAEIPDNAPRKGANYIDGNTVTLVLHAPGKEFAFAIGGFSNWQMAEDFYMNQTPDGGHFWVTIDNLTEGEAYIYQYFVDGEITIADPYTNRIADPWNDHYIDGATYPGLTYPEGKTEGIASVFQTGQESYDWEVTDFTTPDAESLVVYELLIRDFTEEGTVGDIHGVLEKLDYLDSLGVNAIELMPVNEFEGNDSWGYNPSFYFAYDKAYGTPDAFKAFVDSCHKRGIAVFIDMVLNHSFGQSPFVQLYFDPSLGSYGQPTADNPWYNQEHNFANPGAHWGFDFDHESTHTKALIDSINTFWMQEFNIDGFRFDFTKGFSNTSYGESSWGSDYDADRIANLKRMADVIWEHNPDAYVSFEHLAENSEETELADYGIFLWGNMNHNYNEGTMGYTENNKSDLSWISYQKRGWDSPQVLGYMESHDEERLMFKNLEYGNSSGSYDITELSTALNRIELAANFFLTIPGPKMIWQFGELGYDYSIDYDCRVCKKPVKWEYFDEPGRRAVYDVFAALNGLRAEEPAFSTDDYDLDVAGTVKTIVLRHDDMDVVVVGNFDVESHSLDVPFTDANGSWYGFYSGQEVNPDADGITLLPGEYRMYTTKQLTTPDITALPESRSTETAVHTYPNPAQGLMYFRANSKTAGQAILRIYSMQGKLVQTSQHALNTGENTWKLDTSRLPGGMYFYQLSGPETRNSGQFTIR